VLVVDDSSLQRKRLTNMLKRVGYSVEAAVDGHDALQKLKTNDFSVLCVDIVMPLMDGYEFIEKIQTADSVIDPVIFLITGKKITEGAERRRLDALKVAGLFYKPINEEEIINAIDKACLNSAM
jgi:CheY-like chemotaxis protein